MDGFTLRWTLEVVVPDGYDDDEAVMRSIANEAAAHDLSPQSQISRWLGTSILAAEGIIEDDLPDGWSTRIAEIG